MLKFLLDSKSLPSNRETRKSLPAVFDGLFDVLDADGNGLVDMAELASGLSVICGGSSEDKLKATFDMFGAYLRACAA